MSLTNLAFGDESFDVILCYHVFEHIRDDGRAMAELLRVLEQNGLALLQSYQDPDLDATREDPNNESPLERARLFGQQDHFRVYGRDYADRLRAAGFDVTLVDFAAKLGTEEARRYGLDSREVLHVCRKARATPTPS